MRSGRSAASSMHTLPPYFAPTRWKRSMPRAGHQETEIRGDLLGGSRCKRSGIGDRPNPGRSGRITRSVLRQRAHPLFATRALDSPLPCTRRIVLRLHPGSAEVVVPRRRSSRRDECPPTWRPGHRKTAFSAAIAGLASASAKPCDQAQGLQGRSSLVDRGHLPWPSGNRRLLLQ